MLTKWSYSLKLIIVTGRAAFRILLKGIPGGGGGGEGGKRYMLCTLQYI